MKNRFNYVVKSKENLYIEINKTFQKTYLLLSTSILFSAVMALISVKNNFHGINFFLYLITFIGLLYLINLFKSGIFGLILVFIFTGFIGYSTGPMINKFLSIRNGKETLVLSLFCSSLIFMAISFYAIISKKNFEFLNGFLFTASLTIFLLFIINIFINLKILSLTISGLMTIFSSLIILTEVSRIINRGEDNYILATVSLYISIYNLFISLVNIISFFITGKDD